MAKAGPSMALAVLMLLTTAACGSSAKQQAGDVVHAGQIDIKLPPGWKVNKDGNGAVRPVSASASSGGPSAAGRSGATPGDAVPLAKEDPTTKFFKSLGV